MRTFAWFLVIALNLELRLALAEFSPPKVEPFGLDGFRLMLQQQGLDTVQLRLKSAMQAPDETVIVLIGDISESLRITLGLTAFVNDGGALLVATDLGGPSSRGTKRMPWLYRSEFLSTPIAFSSDARLQPKLSDCPVVTNLDRKHSPDLFDGVRSIVANRPGYLGLSDYVQGVAWLPKAAGRARQVSNRESLPLMAVNRLGKGRLLLVADHSIFINEMLIQGDNAQFASNVAHWLVADGNRKRLIVCSDNRLLPAWSFTGTPPSIPLKDLLKSVGRNGLSGLPTGEAILPILNQSLVDFERQGGFNQMAHKIGGSSLSRGTKSTRNLQKPLIFLAALVLFVSARWMFGTRGRPQRWLFTRDDDARQELRLTSAVNEKHHYPYLRTLVREFFVESGITRFSNAEDCPQVVLTQEGKQDKMHGRKIRRLWEIATSHRPIPISSKKSQRHIEEIRNLLDLQSQGRLKLE